MSIGSVIRGVAGGALAVGKAAGNELRDAIAPPVAPEATPAMPADASVDYQPMALPALDPNDPQFAEKQQVHDYIRKMESAHQDYVKSQPDYGKQYQSLADYVNSKPEPHRFSALSAFAIGMGNPDALKNVHSVNAAADAEHAKREQYLLDLRETAMKGNIQKLMEEGNFKKVLTESTALMELQRAQKVADEHRKQANDIAQIQERNKGTLANATVRADAARTSALRRASTLADAWGLTKEERLPVDTMYKNEIEHAVTTDLETGDKVVNNESLLKIRAAWQADVEALGEKLHPERSPDFQAPAKVAPTPSDSAAVRPVTAVAPVAVKGTALVQKPGESATAFQLRKMRAGQ